MPRSSSSARSTSASSSIRSQAQAQTSSVDERLWPHQRETYLFLRDNPRTFDNSDPGTGKTATHVLDYAHRPKQKGRCLILCPKTLMVSAWGADIEKFAPTLTVSYAFANQREAAFVAQTDVVVMNIDGVNWFKDKKNLKHLYAFDHLIIDEYTCYKHPTSQRSKAVAAIRKFFKYRRVLSGTPNPNTVMELWHPALIVDDGKRLGTSYFKLRSAIQTPVQIGPAAQHVRWEDKPGANQAINELLSDITIRHAFESVMTHVPANHRHHKSFELSKTALKAYQRMENDCVLAHKDATITAVHAASLRTKLLQIASGAVYDGGEDSSYVIIDRGRYEFIAELIEPIDHSIVFFNWRHQRELLADEFDKRSITFAVIDGAVPQRERDQIVQRYQAGEYQTLLLHPKTGAHGLTLTTGDTTVFASPLYEADLMKQAIHRVYRGAQDKVTNTIFIEAVGTVEKAVYERLNGKYERMADLLDLMTNRRK